MTIPDDTSAPPPPQHQLALERERLRMAGQLHDEVGAHLLALRLALARLQTRLAAPAQPGQTSAPTWLTQELAQFDLQLAAAQDATRRISHGLWPPILALGLTTALQSLTEQMHDQFGVPCTFAASGPEPVLADEICLNLFLICQEALQNIAKHAAASAASVQLVCDAAGLALKISDNGSGMPVPLPTGFGMRQMQQRAAAMGASLTFWPGKPGTVLQLQLPTPANQPDAAHHHDRREPNCRIDC